jgi:hypothetical protein
MAMSFLRHVFRLCTKKPSTVGYLARLKTEMENGVFCYGSVNPFLLKTENSTVLGYAAAFFKAQITAMVGLKTVEYG